MTPDSIPYKERQEKKRYFVLMKGNDIIGIFGNLRKLCDHVNEREFISYWTLIRKKESDFPIKSGDYTIYKAKYY